jgi:tetratricopeptide (TPR) repeat protein
VSQETMTTSFQNTTTHPAGPSSPSTAAQETILRGIARLLAGDRAGALADFHAAAALAPEWATPWNNAGLVRHMLGQYRAAIAELDQALARQPNYVDALNNRGRAAQALGEFDAAAADFDRALAGAAGAAAVPVLHNRGTLRQQQGDLAGALADFDRALEINQHHIATRIARGLARKQAGALDDAVADFDQALAEQPAHGLAAIYHGRGGVRVLQNKFAEALADYDLALSLEPNNVCYYISRANAHYHKRDVRAVQDFHMAFRLDAEGAAQEVLRTVTADAQRDAAAVLENCTRHLRISARDVLANARRGLTLLLLGRHAEARPDLERVRDLLPDLRPHWQRLVELAGGQWPATPELGPLNAVFTAFADG